MGALEAARGVSHELDDLNINMFSITVIPGGSFQKADTALGRRTRQARGMASGGGARLTQGRMCEGLVSAERERERDKIQTKGEIKVHIETTRSSSLCIFTPKESTKE